MPATDPATQLAREIADLKRRLRSVERASQGAYRSLEVDGQTVTLPDAVRTGIAAGADAGAAKIDAETARLAAVEATTAAQTAATRADDAEAAALEAAGIAADAGKIVYTTSEPTGDSNTLWIPPPSNTPHRWNGTSWEPIPDSGIISAQDAADQAVAAAADAQAAADGKVRTYFQDTAPTGLTAADVGDLWFQTNNGNKLSRWDSSQWVATTYGSAAIAATARQLGSITTFYQSSAPTSGMIAGDLWVNTTTNALSRYSTKWDLVQDSGIKAAADAAAAADKKASDAATAAQTAQNTASAAAGKSDTALTTAQGKNTVTYSLSIPNKTANPGIRVGDLWYQTDSLGGTVIGTWRWSGTDWTSAVFGDAVLASLTVGKLVTGSIAAGQKIIAGGAGGTHAEMSDTGFRVFANNPGGAPSEVIRLGTSDDDYFAVVGADGRLRASVDSNGGGSFSGLTTAQWPTINGSDYTGRGGSLREILDRRPRGLVGWGSDTGIYNVNTAAGRGIFDVSAKMYYGRMYKLVVRCRVNGAVANDALAEVQIRYTWSDDGNDSTWQPAPAAPTINSPIAGRFQASTARPEAQGVYFEKLFSFGGRDDGTYKNVRLLLCMARPVGSTTLQLYGSGVDATEMWVEDIGPALVAAVTPNDGGGGATAPPPAAQAQRYTRSWICDWHENYLPNGSAIALVGASQGHDPANGNMRSYLGFSGPATDGSGLNITTALAGAVVESVSVYLYSWHWYYNSGGTALIGMHGFTSPPGAFGGGNEWMVGAPGFSKPGGKWVDLAPAGMTNWANGTWKGIMLGSSTGADTLTNYGRFTDETDPNSKPVLTITYRK